MTSGIGAGPGHFQKEALQGHHLAACPASLRLQLVCWILLICILPLGPTASAQKAANSTGVSVRISKGAAALIAAEWVAFDTVLQNKGATATPPLAVHLSIAGLDRGKHVDSEDWSPERTQYLLPLQPGESVQLDWKVHALFEGTFVTFVTVVSADDSFRPTVSASLRLEVAPDHILPLRYVVPVAAVVPVLPLALCVFTVVRARRRRNR